MSSPSDFENLVRPDWPKRALVTAGMPNGNKTLHFGHVAGVFVPADCFARFLKDRIGAENVRFISGTDCFGSPIEEGYRKACAAGTFEGTISDYVEYNHGRQKATLDSYLIDLSIYEGSALGRCKDFHQEVSTGFVETLYRNGHLELLSTLQFYDTEAQSFLNGRQVEGRCPVQGCKSEEAYADECALGHQYAPEDLIAPRSALSGTVPELRPVANWYFAFPNFSDFLKEYECRLEEDSELRPVVYQTIKEFLAPPIIYVKEEERDAYEALKDELPEHGFREPEKGKQSFELEFADIGARDTARDLLKRRGLRFRTGKALVPFRISGNLEWGVKTPVIDGVENLTIWVWPESLWAPVSFTMAAQEKMGLPAEGWRDFWCSEDAQVYQFIGQDNLYFYGVAQPALWEALAPGDMYDDQAEHTLKQTRLIASHHILYGDKKASSTHNPPTADELLDYYTPEQLRAHFLALGLGVKSVGFKPKPFDPDVAKRDDPRVADPALKESALLTNIFNRLARSCFYEVQKNFKGDMPLGEPSAEVLVKTREVMAEYERLMHRVEIHSVMTRMDEFIRWANKYWVEGIARADKAADEALRRQVLLDSFFLLRVATLLMHPVVPLGTEMICDYLLFDKKTFFRWDYAFEGMGELCSEEERGQGVHPVKELPPRTDFFKKHPRQFK